MKGDFTRLTFDPANHFSRVLQQQGRVQLDADWNEQVAILLHYLRTAVADMVGPYAGPSQDNGFAVVDVGTLSQADTDRLTASGILPLRSGDILFGRGRYYVDGFLCENDDYTTYTMQPDYPQTGLASGRYLLYLDVHEQDVTCLQYPSIREVALNGPDTTARAKVVWQVKAQPRDAGSAFEASGFPALVAALWQPTNRGLLIAWALTDQTGPIDACTIPPQSAYRGFENQLYRVEVHTGGQIGDAPSFKWSRENGAVTFAIQGAIVSQDATQSITVPVCDLGRGERLGLNVGDWVEVVDDAYTERNLHDPLLRVMAIDHDALTVTLDASSLAAGSGLSAGGDQSLHPLLRRWDQTADGLKGTGIALNPDGTVPISETSGGVQAGGIPLEDGVFIQFQPGTPGPPPSTAIYRAGDYWLIPARTATGDVLWPKQPQLDGSGKPALGPDGTPIMVPVAEPPSGVTHHYAPLALVDVTDGGVQLVNDLRSTFSRLPSP